jgi:hypothetical protein
MIIRTATLCFMAVALVGCSAAADPASEQPVDLTPGKYVMARSFNGLGAFGNRLVQNGPGGENRDICIPHGDTAYVNNDLPRMVFDFVPTCTNSPAERQGNQVSGTITCTLDPQRAMGGTMKVEYSGTVAAESLALSGTMKMELPPSATANMPPERAAETRNAIAAMEALTFDVSFTRAGDCS